MAEEGAFHGFGQIIESGQIRSRAHAENETINISAAWGFLGGSPEVSINLQENWGPRVSGGGDWPYNPDEDPDFQKSLRNHLFSNDDFIFLNPKYRETAARQTYGLQDPCVGEAGGGLSRCRANQECTTGEGGPGVNMDIVIGGVNDPNRNPRGTTLCVATTEAAAANGTGVIPLPTFTLEDFRRLDVAPAVSVVEPSPDTLKNMNTNVYAQAHAQQFQTQVGGFPVAVRAHPVHYTWDYGDGTTLGPTPLSGGPLPQRAWDVPTGTSHVYTTTGDYQVVLSTGFYGEYNVAGTGWQPVAGLNQVTSAPVPVRVWKATTRNVADDCLENPTGWGCPGAQ